MNDVTESINSRLRKIQLREIYAFIEMSDVMECAKILEEILTIHNNLTVCSEERNFIEKVGSICINGSAIQMNLEE